MKFASALVAPAATLLLLLSAASLAYRASDAQDAAIAARAALASARHDERAADTALRAVAAVASVTSVTRAGASAPQTVLSQPKTINDALAGFIVAVTRQAKARSVSLDRLTSAGGKQEAYAAPEAFARAVPLTGGRIHAVRLAMQGRYADYAQFKRFLDDLTSLSAIQSLKLNANHFEGVAEIYGVSR